ncbi:hypothetical protein ACROYT_G014848 [Oculina patagonica]
MLPWTVEDGVAVGIAASADIRKLLGAGGTPKGVVESEAHRCTLFLLAGRACCNCSGTCLEACCTGRMSGLILCGTRVLGSSQSLLRCPDIHSTHSPLSVGRVVLTSDVKERVYVHWQLAFGVSMKIYINWPWFGSVASILVNICPVCSEK